MSEPQPHRMQHPSSATTATETAQQVAPETTAKAQEIGDRMQHEAQRLTEEVKDQGQVMLQDQKRAIADQIGGMANALRSTAEQLQTQDQDAIAQYTQQAADGLERFSQNLKDRDLNTLMGHVEDFARKQPGAFIGSAALLGFLAARFLKSSSERRSTSPSNPSAHSPYASGQSASRSLSGSAAPSTTDRSLVHSTMSPGAETISPAIPKGDN